MDLLHPLPSRPFTVVDLELPHTRSRLRSRDVRRLLRGVYATSSTPVTPPAVASAVARRIDGAVVCGITAAQLHGMALPARLAHSTELHLSRPPECARIRRKGIVGTTTGYLPDETMVADDVVVTCPERTFLDVARHLTDEELVVLGDALVCRHEVGIHAGRAPTSTPEQLADLLERHPGERQVRRCRRALARVRVGADSPQETRLRLALEDHGISGLELNRWFLGPDGKLVEPDLWHEESRTSIQYDGEHHSESRQVVRDVERARRTEAVGAAEVRIVRRDLAETVRFDGLRVPRAVALVATEIRRGLRERRR